MDSAKMILTGDVSPPDLLQNVRRITDASEEKKKQVARQFESVFLEKLVGEMKETVIDWSGEQDGASKQVQGLFWTCLSRSLGEEGGLGLWKEIYQSISDLEPTHRPVDSPG